MKVFGIEWSVIDSYVQMRPPSSTPAAPKTGDVRLYAKIIAGISALVYKDDAGTEHTLTAAGGVADADITFSDITTNNVSTSKHGFAPKLPNDATKYLDGTGSYSVPAGSGSGSAGDMLDYFYRELTNDQTKTSSTTFSDLTGMSFSIGASQKWIVDFNVIYRAGTSGDLKLAVTYPSGCIVDASSFAAGSNLGTDVSDGDARWQNIRPAASGDLVCLWGGNKGGSGNNPITGQLKCRIVNSSTAGTIQLQFAQFSSDSTSTEVFGASGSNGTSFLEARRVL